MSNLGRQFTKVPESVNQIYSGGMGHLEGDESKSATGMVEVHRLLPLRELQRGGRDASPSSQETINSIAEDIRSGKGIENPIMVAYDHKSKWGHIGEGHHRLEAALKAGITHVPVTIYRDRYAGEKRREGKGGHLSMITEFGNADAPPTSEHALGNYVPTNIHPYHFRQFM